VEIQTLARCSQTLASYQKLSGGMHLNKNTGEVVASRQSQCRSENPESLRKSLRHVQRLIKGNFSGGPSELFITLTFGPPLFDYSKAIVEGKNFMGRLRYYYPNIQYIKIIEPHKDGCWHYHILAKHNDGTPLTASNDEIKTLWGNGFVKVSRPKPAVLNGSYFAKPAKQDLFVYYPAHSRIFNCSRGIQRVEPLKMPYHATKEYVTDHKLSYSKTIHVMLEDEEGRQRTANTITYEQWRPG